MKLFAAGFNESRFEFGLSKLLISAILTFLPFLLLPVSGAMQTRIVFKRLPVSTGIAQSPAAGVISGTLTVDGAGVSGAIVALTGAAAQTITTNTSGQYSFASVADGKYTVTASKNGLAFAPASQTVTIAGANQTTDFTGATLCSPPSANLTGKYHAEFSRAFAAGQVQNPYVSVSAGVCQSSTFTGAGGSLDASFGTGGKMTAQINSNDFAYSTAVQTDGKIVAVGYSRVGNSNYDFALARYNADGSPDASFGTGGKMITAIGGGNDFAYTSAIQTDGKIIAAGYTDNGSNYDFALVRYNTDGTLDNSFGAGGKVVTQVGISYEAVYSVAVQTDGKIIAAGNSSNGSNAEDFALVRYNTDGSLDTSFGTNGKVVTPIGGATDTASSTVIQADGKIVAAGYSYNGSNYDFALIRYNTDGSLDTSFGANGKVTTPIGNSSDYAYSAAIQPDGKIVAAGISNNGAQYIYALVRYNVNGSLDTSFGTGGKVTTLIGNSGDYAQSVKIQPNGKIVAAGFSYIGGQNFFSIARYNVNGSLDASFGTNGKIITPIGSATDFGYSAAIQTDGKIIVAGSSFNGSQNVFAVVRYNAGDANLSPADNLRMNFSNISQSGNTVAVPLAANQVPALPTGYALPANAPMYDIRTSAVYSGSIAVTFNAPGIADSQTCNKLRVLHYENGAWNLGAYGTPVYNAGTQICTVSQTATSLSPFVVAQLSGATAAGVSIGGRVLTAKGQGIRNAQITITDAQGKSRSMLTSAFGFYRFEGAAAGQTYVVKAAAKSYQFSQSAQIVNATGDLGEVNFTANDR